MTIEVLHPELSTTVAPLGRLSLPGRAQEFPRMASSRSRQMEASGITSGLAVGNQRLPRWNTCEYSAPSVSRRSRS